MKKIIMSSFLLFSSVFATVEKMPMFLIKIPTKSRPQQFFNRLDLYYEKLSYTVPYHFLINCDIDDATMNNSHVLEQLKKYPNLTIRFDKNTSKIEAYNRGLDDIDFDIVLVTSDDMEPIIQDYDRIIVDTMLEAFPTMDGVLHFSDGHYISQCNTLPIIGKKFYDYFGYAYHPMYKTEWCDAELTFVSRMLRKEKISPLVLIEHKHPGFGTAVNDALYEENAQYSSSDSQIFLKRLNNFFDLSEDDVMGSCTKLWSIIICCAHKDIVWEQNMVNMLQDQIQACKLDDVIEIIVDHTLDEEDFLNKRNSTTFSKLSCKRNELNVNTLGRYHNFIDRDTIITNNYIASIYELLRNNPDVVVLNSGRSTAPLYMCPIKRSIGLLLTFIEKGVTYPEHYWETTIKKCNVIKKIEYANNAVLKFDNSKKNSRNKRRRD